MGDDYYSIRTPFDKKIREAYDYIKRDIAGVLEIPDKMAMDTCGATNRDHWREVWLSADETNNLKIQPDSEREKWAKIEWPKSNPTHETIEKCIKESEKKNESC